MRVAGGLSLDRGAASLSAGVVFPLRKSLDISGHIEWNPFIEILSKSFSPGVVNAYGSVHWAWFQNEQWRLRTSASLGASTLLFRPLGTPVRTVGVCVGVAPLNVQWRVDEHSWFEVAPEWFSPIPSLRGVPFAYPQYRLTVGWLRQF